MICTCIIQNSHLCERLPLEFMHWWKANSCLLYPPHTGTWTCTPDTRVYYCQCECSKVAFWLQLFFVLPFNWILEHGTHKQGIDVLHQSRGFWRYDVVPALCNWCNDASVSQSDASLCLRISCRRLNSKILAITLSYLAHVSTATQLNPRTALYNILGAFSLRVVTPVHAWRSAIHNVVSEPCLERLSICDVIDHMEIFQSPYIRCKQSPCFANNRTGTTAYINNLILCVRIKYFDA